MKIDTLTLQAFRSFAGVTFTFPSRAMVTGLNGAGKSTIREALRYLLTGKAQGLDGKGSGVEVLRPTFVNESTAVHVAAILAGLGPLERTWSPAGGGLAVKSFTGNSGTQQMALYDYLKTTEAFVQAVLETGVFLNLHHADAKSLVLALLNVQIPVPKECGEIFRTSEDKTHERGRVYFTLDELDAEYKQAYDERRVVKAQKVFIQPKPTGEFAPIPAIEDRLTELRKALEGLVLQGGTSGERRRALTARKDLLSTPIPFPVLPEGILAQMADLEARLKAMETEAAGADLDEALQPLQLDLGAGVKVPILRNRAEALAAHKPAGGCVLDPEVRCDTPKVNFSKRAKAMLAELDALPAMVPAVPAALKPPSPMTALRNELDALKALQQAYQTVAAKNEARQTELDAVTAEVASLKDTSEQETQMADVRARIAKGEGILGSARSYQDSLKTHEAGVQQAAAHAKEVERLEGLCEVLGPKGARVDALAKALGPFEAAVNALTQPFSWTVEFLLDPWQVVVNRRPVETYSRSEQYRIGIAVQLSIAQLSGLSFAVVDELDMLDAQNRDLIGRMLYQSPLEQIIILSTRETAIPLPAIPNMVAYRLASTEGRSTIAEQVGI